MEHFGMEINNHSKNQFKWSHSNILVTERSSSSFLESMSTTKEWFFSVSILSFVRKITVEFQTNLVQWTSSSEMGEGQKTLSFLFVRIDFSIGYWRRTSMVWELIYHWNWTNKPISTKSPCEPLNNGISSEKKWRKKVKRSNDHFLVRSFVPKKTRSFRLIFYDVPLSFNHFVADKSLQKKISHSMIDQQAFLDAKALNERIESFQRNHSSIARFWKVRSFVSFLLLFNSFASVWIEQNQRADQDKSTRRVSVNNDNVNGWNTNDSLRGRICSSTSSFH